MRLEVDLSALISKVQQMGAELTNFDIGKVWPDDDIEFDGDLGGSGVYVELEDLESEQGLLSVRGRQVILFIPDHSFGVEEALEDPSLGRKFHVADCTTLDTMKRKNRFERYKVTNNLSGEFEIYGTARHSKKKVESVARLNVCTNCIKMLNYKGAKNSTVPIRNEIVANFEMAEFFSTYSSVFKTLPTQLIEQAKRGYSKDWKKISARLKAEAKYICTSCKVDLSSMKKLLHVHHKNGEKSDNLLSNLVVLCADCHRKEPFHGHLFVKHTDVQYINQMRKEKNIINTQNDWGSVLKYADPAFHGVLDHCKRKGNSPPKIAFKIEDSQGESIELDICWPSRKIGITLGEKVQVPGWTLLSLAHAIEKYK